MLQVIDVPESLLVSGAFRDTQPLIGEVTRVRIDAGEQFTAAKIGHLGCGWRFSSGPHIDTTSADGAISLALKEAHSNPCNRPDASTARATLTTWDMANEMIEARGGFIGDVGHTSIPAWLVEVRGTFMPLDVQDAGLTPPATPTEGALLAIVGKAAGGVTFTVVPR
jgi:hypothetical protein